MRIARWRPLQGPQLPPSSVRALDETEWGRSDHDAAHLGGRAFPVVVLGPVLDFASARFARCWRVVLKAAALRSPCRFDVSKLCILDFHFIDHLPHCGAECGLSKTDARHRLRRRPVLSRRGFDGDLDLALCRRQSVPKRHIRRPRLRGLHRGKHGPSYYGQDWIPDEECLTASLLKRFYRRE